MCPPKLNYQIYEEGIRKPPAERYTVFVEGVFNDYLYREGDGLALVSREEEGDYLFFLDAPTPQDADLLLKRVCTEHTKRSVYTRCNSQLGIELFKSNGFISDVYTNTPDVYILVF